MMMFSNNLLFQPLQYHYGCPVRLYNCLSTVFLNSSGPLETDTRKYKASLHAFLLLLILTLNIYISKNLFHVI